MPGEEKESGESGRWLGYRASSSRRKLAAAGMAKSARSLDDSSESASKPPRRGLERGTRGEALPRSFPGSGTTLIQPSSSGSPASLSPHHLGQVLRNSGKGKKGLLGVSDASVAYGKLVDEEAGEGGVGDSPVGDGEGPPERRAVEEAKESHRGAEPVRRVEDGSFPAGGYGGQQSSGRPANRRDHDSFALSAARAMSRSIIQEPRAGSGAAFSSPYGAGSSARGQRTRAPISASPAAALGSHERDGGAFGYGAEPRPDWRQESVNSGVSPASQAIFAVTEEDEGSEEDYEGYGNGGVFTETGIAAEASIGSQYEYHDGGIGDMASEDGDSRDSETRGEAIFRHEQSTQQSTLRHRGGRGDGISHLAHENDSRRFQAVLPGSTSSDNTSTGSVPWGSGSGTDASAQRMDYTDDDPRPSGRLPRSRSRRVMPRQSSNESDG